MTRNSFEGGKIAKLPPFLLVLDSNAHLNSESQTSQEPEIETAIGASGMSLKNAAGKIRL